MVYSSVLCRYLRHLFRTQGDLQEVLVPSWRNREKGDQATELLKVRSTRCSRRPQIQALVSGLAWFSPPPSCLLVLTWKISMLVLASLMSSSLPKLLASWSLYQAGQWLESDVCGLDFWCAYSFQILGNCSSFFSLILSGYNPKSVSSVTPASPPWGSHQYLHGSLCNVRDQFRISLCFAGFMEVWCGNLPYFLDDGGMSSSTYFPVIPWTDLCKLGAQWVSLSS